ncbi:hypothetical protein RhiirC2_796348, partial [Rhizophagus irregularis]
IGTDDTTLENFIYEELKKRLGSKTAHVRKSPFTPKSVYTTKKVIKKIVLKKSSKLARHCSVCAKAGHTKVNCPRVKRTKKVNHVYQDVEENPEDSEEECIAEEKDESEEEEIEDDDENDDDDDSPLIETAMLKASGNIIMATDQVYQIALKSIISSLVPHCPKEILCYENDTVKRRELAWENVTRKVQEVLFPLMQATNAEQKLLLQVPENNSNESVQNTSSPNEDIVMADSTKIKEINTTSSSHVLPESIWLEYAIKAYAMAQKKNSQIYWPKPLEINFLQIKDADDVATIYCKIGGLVIPCTGSDSSIFSDNIAELVEELLGIKINRKKIHRLNGVASQSISIGTIDNVPITISSGENTATITDEFSVVPAERDQNGNAKSLVILGTQWQYRAG